VSRATDVVVIGSGINGLVAAACLARSGLAVEVFERSQSAGGAVRSEELTEPGYFHDTFSAVHTTFRLSGAYADLGEELAARGLGYRETPDETTATVLPDGVVMIAYRDIDRTAASFDERDRAAYRRELKGFGAAAPAVGALLETELYSPRAAGLAWRLGCSLGRRGGLALAADVLASTRAWWLSDRFITDGPANLYSPWTVHTGLSPDSTGSGFQVLGSRQRFTRPACLWWRAGRRTSYEHSCS
jgi:phytoene dehydrogenase-like protein